MIPCFLETVKQKDCSTWTKYNYFFLLFHSVYMILFLSADSILTRQISSSVCIMLHIQQYFYSPEIFKQKSGIWKKHNHFFQIPHLIIYGSVSGSVSNFNKINLIILCTSFSSTISVPSSWLQFALINWTLVIATCPDKYFPKKIASLKSTTPFVLQSP